MIEITEKNLKDLSLVRRETLLRRFPSLPTHGIDGTPIDTDLYCLESLYSDDEGGPRESPIKFVAAATAEAPACSKELWPVEANISKPVKATKAVCKPGPLASLAIRQHVIQVEPFVLARPPSKGNDPALMTAVGLFAYSLAGLYLLVKISSRVNSNTILQAIAFLEFDQMTETKLPMLSD